MEEIRRLGVRVGEERPAPGFVLAPRQQGGAEPVEHRFAGMQPDDVRAIRGPVDGEAPVRAGGIGLHGAEHGIQAAPPLRGELEDAVGVSIDAQIDQGRRARDEPADVAGQQPAVLFPVDGLLQRGKAALDVAAPEQRPLPVGECAHLLLGQQAFDAGDGRGRARIRRCLLEVLLERDVLEQAAHDVEDLVRLKLPADQLQLVEERLQHAALARLARDEVDYDDRVVPLPVAVDPAHPLFEAGRVPRHVVVHHQPAELQVDSFAGGVGRYQVAGAAVVERTAEQLHLRLPRAVVEAAVDQCDLPGEAEPIEAADQERRRVAVLGEDDELLAGEARVAQHPAELLELRILALVGQAARLREQRLHLDAFLAKLGQGRRDDAAERTLLERLVTLASARLVGVFIRRPGLEEVGDRGETILAALQLVPRVRRAPCRSLRPAGRDVARTTASAHTSSSPAGAGKRSSPAAPPSDSGGAPGCRSRRCSASSPRRAPARTGSAHS